MKTLGELKTLLAGVGSQDGIREEGSDQGAFPAYCAVTDFQTKNSAGSEKRKQRQ